MHNRSRVSLNAVRIFATIASSGNTSPRLREAADPDRYAVSAPRGNLPVAWRKTTDDEDQRVGAVRQSLAG